MLQRLDKCLFFQKLVYLHTKGKDDLFLTNAYRVLTGKYQVYEIKQNDRYKMFTCNEKTKGF